MVYQSPYGIRNFIYYNSGGKQNEYQSPYGIRNVEPEETTPKVVEPVSIPVRDKEPKWRSSYLASKLYQSPYGIRNLNTKIEIIKHIFNLYQSPYGIRNTFVTDPALSYKGPKKVSIPVRDKVAAQRILRRTRICINPRTG